MKAIDNLIRLFKINNHPEYAESEIFHKFIEEKKVEPVSYTHLTLPTIRLV